MDWEYSAQLESLRRIWDNNRDTLLVAPPMTSQVSNATIGDNQMIEEDMDMDVDPSDYLIIIPDTNIWMGSLTLLQKLLNTDFEKVSYPTIIIPWMVLQELDGIMKQSRKDQAFHDARKAITFIHDLLMSRHPRVRGQKASEAVQAEEQFKSVNADDRILQCALQYVEKSSHIIVVFITDDRNLLNKALVEYCDETRRSLVVCNSNTAIDKIKQKIYHEMGGEPNVHQAIPDFTRVPDGSNKISTKKTSAEILPTRRTSPRRKSSSGSITSSIRLPAVTQKSVSKTNNLPTKSSTSTSLVKSLKRLSDYSLQPLTKLDLQKTDTSYRSTKAASANSSRHSSFVAPALNFEIPSRCSSFQEVITVMRQMFSYIIEFKMKEDFGERFWKRSLKYQPPWNLETALKTLIHHHFAVFCSIFGRNSKPQIEGLLGLIQDYNKAKRSCSKADSIKQQEEDIIELALTIILLARTRSRDSEFCKNQKVLDCEKPLSDYLTQHKL